MPRRRRAGDIVCEVAIYIGLMALLGSAVGVVAYAARSFWTP